MFLPQLVEDVGGVEAGVVAQLTRDDLERLRHGRDDQLFLASDRSENERRSLENLGVNMRGQLVEKNYIVIHDTYTSSHISHQLHKLTTVTNVPAVSFILNTVSHKKTSRLFITR